MVAILQQWNFLCQFQNIGTINKVEGRLVLTARSQVQKCQYSFFFTHQEAFHLRFRLLQALWHWYVNILAFFESLRQNTSTMAKKTAPLLPSVDELLQRFGDRLRLARLRRRLPAKQVAERAGMSPMTLRSLERGGSGVTMGAYLAVMQVLGIEGDLDLLARADPVGRELQDSRLRPTASSTRRIAESPTRRSTRSSPSDWGASQLGKPIPSAQTEPGLSSWPTPAVSAEEESWIKSGDFASADVLSSLIAKAGAPAKKAR
ncbi:helix-turn-helix transcriptional regulator [Aquabacterium sp.]|uniref:helix-turn-helix domain-containing protein n=1 Tax=Aquabacterium sp. TaxID=1872578 RepID=UPI0024880E5E|nr:helix-turn-helix transcriptional regulator [Aquabacterium sp.]MDI1351111.1 helix-turn-helix transcriptional regulator [Aquabacterium sp.]